MISVCIPTYNGEKYISEQLASILSQIGAQDEIIVSDDGSVDHTLSIIKSMADSRIKLINGAGKHSVTKNVEVALSQAQGDYIFLADQDDVWFPNKVEIFMQWLQKYDCVVSDAVVVDEKRRLKSPSLYRVMNVRKGRLYNTFWKNGYTGCCMAFTKRVKDYALPFPEQIPMHDIWIGNVAAYHFKVVFIPKPLIYFRRHGATISCNTYGSKFSWRDKIRFRWNIVKCLCLLKQNKR